MLASGSFSRRFIAGFHASSSFSVSSFDQMLQFLVLKFFRLTESFPVFKLKRPLALSYQFLQIVQIQIQESFQRSFF